ncbi:Kunitz/Bovine pancreatic trypsin inhibitor domain protein, partial [Cooperia oncophora]
LLYISDVCPAGLPAGGGPTSCGEDNPCRDGYECVTAGASQYCCPSRENACSLPRHSGSACANSRPAITRYYFDVSTGSCRSFQFSQCGGNANNFNSLEECEGFCLDTQCQHGQAYRVGAVNAVCALTATNTCPQSHSCMSPVFGPSAVCCPNPELTCNEMVSAGTPCFGRSVTIQRFYFNPSTRKCQAFQYYGCNGNGNNFHSMQSCQDHCLNSAESGSTSVVACNVDADECPSGNSCVESSSVPGFHMCCSTTGSVSRRPNGFGSARKEPNTLAALIRRYAPSSTVIEFVLYKFEFAQFS